MCFRFVGYFCRLEKGVRVKNSFSYINCIYRYSTQKKFPFQNLSLGFILKVFLKFRKFSSLDLPSPSKTLKIKVPVN